MAAERKVGSLTCGPYPRTHTRQWDAGRVQRQQPSRYTERVGAPFFLWLLVAVLSVSLGVAYGAAIGYHWGFLVFLIVQGLGTWWLSLARSRIVVDDDSLIAGRATLPLEFVGTVLTLDSEELRYAAGPGADARAFLLLRGSASTGVKVVLNDPADPTPYWLVATRRPTELRDAIVAARDAKAVREP